ncbi:MAG: flagellar FlbD family protein [Brevinematales bacterium]|nr:flagellar FlbD family protein [Brevinematales bacterium]
MVKVTRLNNTPLYINYFQVETIEAHPDTVITLMNGTRYVIREKPEEVIGAFRRFLASSVAEGIRLSKEG